MSDENSSHLDLVCGCERLKFPECLRVPQYDSSGFQWVPAPFAVPVRVHLQNTSEAAGESPSASRIHRAALVSTPPLLRIMGPIIPQPVGLAIYEESITVAPVKY